MTRRGSATAALACVFAFAIAQLAAQIESGPPILLPTPSNASAPAASAHFFSQGGILRVNSVIVDGQDNVYIGGSANDLVQLPGFPAIYGRKASSDGDAIVAKFDRTGRPLWASFFGGSDGRRTSRLPVPDTVLGLAVDAAGQVYAAGSTQSTDFPIVGGFQTSPGSMALGTSDGFFVKLSGDGQRILYSTYYGGEVGTSLSDVRVSGAGEVWLGASTASTSLFTTHDFSGGSGRAIVLKLSPAGSVVWSSRLPLSTLSGLEVDLSGEVVVVGNCSSGCGIGAPAAGGPGVLRLANTGAPIRNTSVLPTGLAAVSSVALGPGGRVYLAGNTTDPALPVRNAWQPQHGGGNVQFPGIDAFVAILSATGQIETLSYLGGSADETLPLIAVAANGELTVAVYTNSNNLPVARALVDHQVDGPVYRSLDRGLSWHVVGRTSQPATPAFDLAFDVHRQAIHVAASIIATTRDLGQTWELERREPFSSLSADRLRIDPRRATHRYAAMSGNIHRFDEATGVWTMVLRSVPGAYLRTLEVSPHDSSVWAGGNFGVEVSTDGGASWSRRITGLPAALNHPDPAARMSPNVIAFHPTDPRTVYAGAGFGLYVTTNLGGSWEPLVTNLQPVPDVTGIAFDPVDPRVLHLSTRNGGLLRCADGGRSCARKLSDHSLTAVATDPQKRHVVYTAGLAPDGRPSFHLSIDHGETWHRSTAGFDLRGVPTSLLVDPRDSSRLFVTNDWHSFVPYVIRFRPTSPGAATYTADFASYLASGSPTALALTSVGEAVVGLTQSWRNAFASNAAYARIAR
jgi:hypothetical protein